MEENESYSIVKITTFRYLKNSRTKRRFAAFRRDYMRKRYEHDIERMSESYGIEMLECKFDDFEAKFILNAPEYDDIVLMIRKLDSSFSSAFRKELVNVRFYRCVLFFDSLEEAKKNFENTDEKWMKL